MELGLSLGETMADAGRDLVLGLGMGIGVGASKDEEAGTVREARRELEFGAGRRCGRPSPEPAVRLTLVPSLGGLPWPPSSSEATRHLEASTRGFDVNRAPSLSVAGAAAEDDEEQDDAGAGAAAAAASSSPNDSAGSFPTDFCPQGQASTGGGGDRAGSRASDDDDGGSARKKLRLSKEQSAFLEESFKEHATLNPKQKLALAKQLNLLPRQVEVWFQNRRARTKLKQTEVDCEYLKRCCETLTEENRRLQKELAELRALKTVHPFYMHLPATTLSMCPSCERVASNPTSASASAPASSTPPPATPAIATTNHTAAVAAPARAEHRPTSFAALFSSPLNRPPVAQPQPQAQAPASS
ncbi:Homeobox-leucine zipper protein HOX11 [Dichanthelium oligosanthes]|uniref:Homeobox-leucine zipper protein HOX11 n=1 Tax=Dichanthelium oligosanthes TaxID=888268 RepID=A0A1E5V740_9POAL|nr:Homeobox-leucine zipper protein HOX11 [Dichanthelium oligosanthes]